MLRFDVYGVYRDFVMFLRRNTVKFVIVAVFAVVGCGLGIRNAFVVTAKDGVACIERYNIYLLVCGTRGFFGYFLSRAASYFFIMLAMSLLSYRIYTAWINVGIVFSYCYFGFRSATVSVILLKITFFPAAVLCVFPFTLLFAAVMCCVCVYSLDRCGEFRLFGGDGYGPCVFSVCRRLVFPFCLTVLISLSESLLALILTLPVTV